MQQAKTSVIQFKYMIIFTGWSCSWYCYSIALYSAAQLILLALVTYLDPIWSKSPNKSNLLNSMSIKPQKLRQGGIKDCCWTGLFLLYEIIK